MNRTADIVVVGAGPAGLAGALHLKLLGHDVLLVAPIAGPVDERTSALLGGSVELLERIGAWQAASLEAAPLRSLRIADGTRRLFRAPEVLFHADEIGLEAFGYNLPNRALVAALEAVAARTGLARLTGTVESLTVAPDRATLKVAGTATLHLVPNASAQRILRRGGALSGTLRLTFKPKSGKAQKAALTVRLK